MTDHSSRERAASPNATAPAKLPALPAVRVSDPGLQRWIEAAQQWFNTRAGATDPFERALTVRDLVQFGLVDGAVAYRGTQQRSITPPSTVPGGAGILVQTPSGTFPLSVDAFAKAIADTALFRDLMTRLDDPRRFDRLPEEIKAVLTKSIADEAAARGAEVRRLDSRIQEEGRSLAFSLQEVTASVEGSMAGVRELSFASATQARAVAGQVTQVQARIDGVPVDPAAVLATVHATLAALQAAIPEGVQGKYYQVDDPGSAENFLYRWDGAGYVLAGHGNTTAGTATVEQAMLAVADRSEGLEARYTLKVQAGNKLAGFGIAATENDGATTSAFVIAADKFAIVDPGETIVDPLNPPVARVPFGVDTANNTVYINGNVRINAGGPQLSGLTSTEKTVVVFAYKRSASAPGDNPGDGGVYDFDTKVLSGLANGWSAGIPAADGNPLYVRAATASSSGATDTITGAEWSGAVLMVQDGDDGAAGTNGLNSATVQLFRRTTTSTAPTLGGASPTNDLTYTFSTGVLSGTPPTSWTTTIPAAANGAYLWTVRATAASTGATDTITVAEWSAVQALAQDGNVGRTVACYTDIGTQVFTLNGNGTGVNESSGIQPRRTLAGFAGTGTTVWSVVSGTFTGATTTLSESDGRMANVSVDELGTDSITLRCTYTEGSFTASDDITFYKSRDGIGAYLTNESHTLPASDVGVVSSYTGATGTFKVSDGGRDVASSQLAFTVQSYTGFSGGGGISIGSTGIYTVSSGIQNASDVATVTLRCVYARVMGSSVTIDRVFTITKAKQGAQGNVGGTGGTGPSGTRGTRQLYATSGSYTSGYGAGNYATQATSLIASATAGSTPTTPINGDTVTFTNGTDYTYTITHNGSSWAPPGVVIDGSLLVTGSITSTKLNATAIDGKTITGSTIRTAASGARCEINHTNNEINGYNSGGTKTFYMSMSSGLFYLAGAAPILQLAEITNAGAGRALQVTNTSTGGALKATAGAGHAVEGGSSSGAGVRGISSSGEGVYGTSTSGPGGRFSSLRIDQGSAAGSAQWLLPNGGSTASGKPGANSTGVFVPLNMNGAPGYILWWPA